MISILILLFGSILGGAICFGEHWQPSVGRHNINYTTCNGSAPFSDRCCDAVFSPLVNETSINPNATNYTNASNITQEQLIVNESTSESCVEGIDHTNSINNNCFVNCIFDDEYIVNDEGFSQGETDYKMHRKVIIYLACSLLSSLYHILLVTLQHIFLLHPNRFLSYLGI